MRIRHEWDSLRCHWPSTQLVIVDVKEWVEDECLQHHVRPIEGSEEGSIFDLAVSDSPQIFLSDEQSVEPGAVCRREHLHHGEHSS